MSARSSACTSSRSGRVQSAPASQGRELRRVHLIVYKTAQYDQHTRTIEFGEVDIFLGVGFVIAVSGTAPRATREGRGVGSRSAPSCSRSGPAAVVWGILGHGRGRLRPGRRGPGERDRGDGASDLAGQEDLTKRIHFLQDRAQRAHREQSRFFLAHVLQA